MFVKSRIEVENGQMLICYDDVEASFCFVIDKVLCILGQL
jgi:hypothetical protein